MYCPCCGFKNSESASFCRSCGADSQTICDTLEGRIPTAIAAKLLLKKVKGRLGRRTEYFRLQSLTALTWTLAFLGLQIHYRHFPYPLSTPIFISIFTAGLYWFVSSFLAYKRSKVFYKKSERQAALPAGLFCPYCGNQSTLEASYCGSCGQSLEAVTRTLQSRPSRLARYLDDRILRADDAFDRMSQRKLMTMILMSLIGGALLSVGLVLDFTVDGLFFMLLYVPSGLLYLQMLMTRQKERAAWSPVRARENAARILDWLAVNPARFEEQGVSEKFLTDVLGLRGIEAAEAALDLLENREVVVRQPERTAPEGILVKPGRFWPQTRALSGSQYSHQASSSGARPTEGLDDPSAETTRRLTQPDKVSFDPGS